MRKRGVLREYTNWIACKVSGCHTTLKFDRFESEVFPLSKGLDQGCPLSGLAFQFYNADLIDISVPGNGEDAMAFMDDTLLQARGESLRVTNEQVKRMMTRKGGGLEWSLMHQCEFAIDKFRVMGLTRREGNQTHEAEREPGPFRGVRSTFKGSRCQPQQH